MITKNSKMSEFEYTCELCEYFTSNKGDYNKHLITAKHKRVTSGDIKLLKPHTCNCGKEFKHRQGLWKHKQKCNENIHTSTTMNENDDAKYELLTNTILELVKKNDELATSIVEISKNMGNNNNNNNTTHNTVNNNHKFNLNVFLNEKCKNAMTLKDYIKSINISIQDFIETGERGFIDGISNIILERINEMEIHDRPLHCTDLKRETVYIKDEDKWEKDEDKVKLRKAVKGVAYKNERMRPVWYDSTPDVGIMGTENYEKFFKYSESSLGGCGKEETKLFEDKVMKNVLREVTINKDTSITN